MVIVFLELVVHYDSCYDTEDSWLDKKVGKGWSFLGIFKRSSIFNQLPLPQQFLLLFKKYTWL